MKFPGGRVVLVAVALTLSLACGGPAPQKMSDLPVFAGAKELEPGNNAIASTLRNNETQAKAMGQTIEQRAFSLPKDASWDKLNGFYGEKLGAMGWKEGVASAGPGAGMANDIVKNALSQANKGSDFLKTAIYHRGRQTLTVMRLQGATGRGDAQAILSLNTN